MGKKAAFSAGFILGILNIFVLTLGLYAQGTGKVSGKVIDSLSGDPIIGVNVIIRELRIVASTDIDGNYTLQGVPEGKHKVEFRMMSYDTSVAEVDVVPGKAAKVNITMSFKTAQEVVVTAKRINNTAAALISIRKKAPAAQDAISSEQIEKSPDSDAADTAKRVTGITILGGKYIFVRGLEERYSGVLVNGSQVSSPLPNKRVIPLDIFPTGLMDNMIVSKTYLPSMPAEFGGGLITINTKDFPEEEQLRIGLSTSFNSETTFKNFYTFDGGKLDWLGYDDGTYAMPNSVDSSSVALRPAGLLPGYTTDQLVEYRKDFSEIYEAETATAMPGGKISFSYGDSYEFDEIKGERIGLLLSASQKTGYATTHGHYKRYESGIIEADYDYDQSKQTTNTSLLLLAAYSLNRNNEIKLTSFYTHDSEKTARLKDGQMGGSTFGSQDVLQVVYTTQVFSQLAGRHVFGSLNNSKLEWNSAFSWANRDQPDTRVAYRNNSGDIYATEPFRRYFNEFNEFTYDFNPWVTIPFKQWSGLQSKLQVGTGYSHKTRRNDSRRFKYVIDPTVDENTLSGIDDYPTLIDLGNYQIYETTGTSDTSGFDSYEGDLNILAGYGMVDMPLISKLRLVTGLRFEKWQQEVDSFNQFNTSQKTSSKIEDTDLVPSANMVYSATDNINFRIAYSRTINRPDFIEASDFKYYDELETGGVIRGNPDLKKAVINNYDARFEFFQNSTDLIAASVFYKEIEDPIEAAILDIGGDLFFTYYNQEKADNYGAEIEVNKNLGFISKVLKNISIYGNYTYIVSKITLNSESSGQDSDRPLQGQSPWVVNTGFFFDNKDWGTSASLLFNMFGRRITQVSTVPEDGHIYEESYPKLDVSLSQTLGIYSLKLNVENILDPDIERTQEIDGEKQTIDSYNKGITTSLSVSAKF